MAKYYRRDQETEDDCDQPSREGLKKLIYYVKKTPTYRRSKNQDCIF